MIFDCWASLPLFPTPLFKQFVPTLPRGTISLPSPFSNNLSRSSLVWNNLSLRPLSNKNSQPAPSTILDQNWMACLVHWLPLSLLPSLQGTPFQLTFFRILHATTYFFPHTPCYHLLSFRASRNLKSSKPTCLFLPSHLRSPMNLGASC